MVCERESSSEEQHEHRRTTASSSSHVSSSIRHCPSSIIKNEQQLNLCDCPSPLLSIFAVTRARLAQAEEVTTSAFSPSALASASASSFAP